MLLQSCSAQYFPVAQGLCFLLPSAQGDTSTTHGRSTSACLSKCSFCPTNTVLPCCFLYSEYLEYWCLQRITEIVIKQLMTWWQLPLCNTGISFSQESRQGLTLGILPCTGQAEQTSMVWSGMRLCLPGTPVPCHAMPWGSRWPLSASCHGGCHGGSSVDPLLAQKMIWMLSWDCWLPTPPQPTAFCQDSPTFLLQLAQAPRATHQHMEKHPRGKCI